MRSSCARHTQAAPARAAAAWMCFTAAWALFTIGAARPADAAAGRQWTPEAVVDTVAVDDVSIAPDGGTVLFTRSRWRGPDDKPGPAFTNIWRVGFDGGPAQRLTTYDAADKAPRFSPDGDWIAFLSARRPDSTKKQIWIMPARGGEAGAMTDPKLDVLLFAWSPDSASIAFVAEDPKSEAREKDEKAGRDAVVVDGDLRPRRVRILDIAGGKVEPLASAGDLSAWALDWAPDSSALVAGVTDINRTDESYVAKRLVVLPRRGARRELVPIVGKIGPVAWSQDGRSIAWLGGVDASDPTTGSLFVVPAAGGRPKNLTGGREETLQSIAWRPDGTIAGAAVAGAASTLLSVDPGSGAWRTTPEAGAVSFTEAAWSKDGARYAFAGSTAAHPDDVFAGAGAAKPRRIARANPQLGGLPRGAQEVIRYGAADGLMIEAVLIRPPGAAAGTRHPLVVIVHGGPESQYLDGWRNSYSAPGQALAERGFAVMLPNYRGSAGRGVAYAKADHRDLGGKEFTDILDGIDHLVAKGLVDPKRVGMMGGSYGGYMTALAVTRDSARFAAGVEMFGITDWESFLGQSDIPVENSQVHWALWCYDEPRLCRERSASGHIGKAGTPTLILQGEDDLRVPKPQSDQLYAALRHRKVPVEYVVYPREEHGLKEREHRLDALARILGWFERHLGAAR